MPELPEVEVVRRGLDMHLSGRTLKGIRVLHSRPVRSHPGGPDGFITALQGRRVAAIERRGKYLWAQLDEDALVIHLGMSGQVRVNHPSDEYLPHTRVLFDLDDGRQVRYVDQRMFGSLEWHPGKAECPVPHIARDPFDEHYDEYGVARKLRARRTGVKRAILDQKLVSGIGNIYADEALWRARIHFDHPSDELGPRKALSLLRSAREVMAEALAAGGTSFDALYVDVDGESGYFERALNAYSREGKACRRCGTPIVRCSFMNRSSYLCPKCQRAPKGATT